MTPRAAQLGPGSFRELPPWSRLECVPTVLSPHRAQRGQGLSGGWRLPGLLSLSLLDLFQGVEWKEWALEAPASPSVKWGTVDPRGSCRSLQGCRVPAGPAGPGEGWGSSRAQKPPSLSKWGSGPSPLRLGCLCSCCRLRAGVGVEG